MDEDLKMINETIADGGMANGNAPAVHKKLNGSQQMANGNAPAQQMANGDNAPDGLLDAPPIGWCRDLRQVAHLSKEEVCEFPDIVLGKQPFRKHLRNIQGPFREHSGNIQGPFKEHSGNIQCRDLRQVEHSGNVHGTFREHSGNIQGTFREHSGNIQGTFREHSGNI
jgi:hypothetical protein